ncbi:molecular chaperone HtpG [Oribacterium sp. KHPX15]|uniref:molecular chaperone HtpG n=1 Tax=Oribacterium sp. KHPX15 TaxID=1855342 RepID=UPI0008943A08|nr:molecular chaperone HtpG [Oribacterium sp. KHPX15]SEA24870.1 molecular chaperone HtpG [Oribacterium sp. KHPX15]
MSKKGSLSINSENIFPIIKKWMYSDQDIFVREVISNACDAITKLDKLSLIGEFTKPSDYKGRVDVIVDSDKRTVTIKDNGLGMTEEEVDKYINQIAFSGATDFINTYKDKANDDQIIGHFGLGFYSVFMVSDKVEIDTLSYKEGAKAVHWVCNGGTDFELTEGNKTDIGTVITLHLNDDCLKYDNEWEMREIIDKYCSFMPVEIYITKLPKDTETIDADKKNDSDVVLEEIPGKTETDKDGKETKTPAKVKIEKRPVLLNDTNPLWTKSPSECKKEDYIDFYHKVFHDYKEPLFWIHLNMDYPYNLKGILYFPKINMEYESAEGTIKLYNNQVFVADNIKEVIPEYLMLLKGVIDCPDLPLNVSRSQLQNDGFVKKISDYITKKVADKLSGMCKVDRENYEKYWDDIAPFIKYGCLRDDKFCKKMTDYILFKDINGKYLALPECLEVNKIDTENDNADASSNDSAETTVENTEASETKTEDNKDSGEAEKEKNKVIYYVTDAVQQSQYIAMFKEAGKDAVVLPERIDQPFISELEAKNQGVHFKRIDADLTEEFKADTSEDEEKLLEEQSKSLETEIRTATKKETLTVKLQKMTQAKTAAMLSISEEGRRMNDMMKMYAMQGMGMADMPVQETLILNTEHPLVKYLMENGKDEAKKETINLISEQLYDLARIQQSPLPAEEMTKFIERSNDILLKMAE